LPFPIDIAQAVNRSKLTGDIEKTAALPVLHLDNPNIRIKVDLADEFLFGFSRIDPGVAMEPREQTFVAILHFALRRRSEQSGETVEPVNLDKNRASLGRATPAQYCGGAFMRATPEIGRHPNIRAQPHALRPAIARSAAGYRSRSRDGGGTGGPRSVDAGDHFIEEFADILMRLIFEYDPGSRAERSHQRAARRHRRQVDHLVGIDGDWGTIGARQSHERHCGVLLFFAAGRPAAW
jgi:hypothetical protein